MKQGILIANAAIFGPPWAPTNVAPALTSDSPDFFCIPGYPALFHCVFHGEHINVFREEGSA